MTAYINGVYLEEEQAVLKVHDLAIQRGYAAFDYFRTVNHRALFLDDYLDRFLQSAASLHLRPEISREELKEIILVLLEKNQVSESGIRLIFTGGYSPDAYTPVAPNLIITQQALQLPTAETFSMGIKVIDYEYQRDLPHIKSTNYLMGIWLQEEMRRQGAADVIYHRQGMVTEFPRANLFMVSADGRLVTPARHILQGITRMKILQMAKMKYPVEIRDVSLTELQTASEIFMTSTTKRILPVSQLNRLRIGTGRAGPVASWLNNQFIQLERDLTGGNG